MYFASCSRSPRSMNRPTRDPKYARRWTVTVPFGGPLFRYHTWKASAVIMATNRTSSAAPPTAGVTAAGRSRVDSYPACPDVARGTVRTAPPDGDTPGRDHGEHLSVSRADRVVRYMTVGSIRPANLFTAG